MEKWIILMFLGVIIAVGVWVMQKAVYQSEKHEIPLTYFFGFWFSLILCWMGFCKVL